MAGAGRRAGDQEGAAMAIGVVFEGQGVTQAQYDQVLKEVSPDNRPPPGMLYHVAGPMEGGWRVVEVWESQDAVDRFFQEKLGEALQKANINVRPQVFQVHNTMQAR
jgi:quinol monooxygenase YgiN